MAFAGKTAVITGATGGIGLSLAKHYLNGGIQNLALLDVHPNEEKIAPLRNAHIDANIIFLVVDVTRRDSIELTYKTILEEFKEIDIVVNAAGVVRERDVELCVATNLTGLINASYTALNAMSKANGGNGGVILNIASVAGVAVNPGIPAYIATKHGVVGFTRAMGHDCYFNKHGVKFVVICPGLTETTMADDIRKNIIFEEAKAPFTKLLDQTPLQTADACGKLIVDVTSVAENGSVWLVDGGKSREITIPNPLIR